MMKHGDYKKVVSYIREKCLEADIDLVPAGLKPKYWVEFACAKDQKARSKAALKLMKDSTESYPARCERVAFEIMSACALDDQLATLEQAEELFRRKFFAEFEMSDDTKSVPWTIDDVITFWTVAYVEQFGVCCYAKSTEEQASGSWVDRALEEIKVAELRSELIEGALDEIQKKHAPTS